MGGRKRWPYDKRQKLDDEILEHDQEEGNQEIEAEPLVSDAWGYKRVKGEGYQRIGIMLIKDSGNRFRQCAATLIGQRWVITAAHCVVDWTNPVTDEPFDGGAIFRDIDSFRFFPGAHVNSQEFLELKRDMIGGGNTMGFKALAFYVPRGYIHSGYKQSDPPNYEEDDPIDYEHDYALVHLTMRTDAPYRDKWPKGWFGYGHCEDKYLLGQRYLHAGYPPDVENEVKDGGDPHSYMHMGYGIFREQSYLKPKYFALKYKMGKGESGSGIWRKYGPNIIYGIAAQSKKVPKNEMFGGKIGGPKRRLGKHQVKFTRITKIRFNLIKAILERTNNNGDIQQDHPLNIYQPDQYQPYQPIYPFESIKYITIGIILGASWLCCFGIICGIGGIFGSIFHKYLQKSNSKHNAKNEPNSACV